MADAGGGRGHPTPWAWLNEALTDPARDPESYCLPAEDWDRLGPLSLMFLNNNLHALHHAEPGLAWYRLPARYRARRQELLAGNGGYRYGGYLEIAARYLVKPKEHPRHPLQASPETAPAG